MKLLITALLCLLLAGCSQTESAPLAQVPQEPPVSAEYLGYTDAVKAFPLPDTEQLFVTDRGLLLQSGSSLTLLDADFQPAASRTLEYVPELRISDNTIAAFDPLSRTLSLLGSSLEDLRTLTLPPELTGSPVYAQDTVYYCTASGIYRWDLDRGIRRRIRENSQQALRLVAVHRNGTILQCRVPEDDREWDFFADTQSGQLLTELNTTACLNTIQDRYYCIFASGSLENLVFGSGETQPVGLFPQTHGHGFFLPESHCALTLDDSVLTCYDLETGLLRDTLTLHHPPEASAELGSTVLLLIREDQQPFLLQWQPKDTPPSGKNHTAPWFTADSPDHAGLALCKDYAQSLSETYGLEVRIWKEAAAVAPWDYAFTPEYRYPVILSQLQTLEACLNRYPRALLADTASHFDGLKICLVQSIAGTAAEESLNTATGIQFLDGTEAYIVLSAGAYQEQALYHELFHVMETRILSRSNALDRWNELNPAGFSYDLDHTANALRNSGVYLEGRTRAFVDTYSMSFPKEDRARIFEYAMLPDSAHLFRSETMQQKLSAVCTGIREAYDLKKSEETFPWEQYLE